MTFLKNIKNLNRIIQLASALLFLIAINLIFRGVLEQPDKYLVDYFSIYYVDTLEQVYSYPWYQLLLPIKEWTGSWTGTSLVLLPPLTQWIGSFTTLYLLLNAMFIIVVFITSHLAFRSIIFTFTAGLCAALTTYNYHAYSISGSVNQYFIVSYLFIFLLGNLKLMTHEKPAQSYWITWGVGLFLYVLSYEGWLDFLTYFCVVSPFFLFYLKRNEKNWAFKRLSLLSAVYLVVGFVYIIIKVKYGYGQQTHSESDVVFNYSSVILIFEDLVSNTLTMFYSVVTIFVPPWIGASNSLWLLGSEYLQESQGGYHKNMQHMVEYNHLFYWRYFAGASFALFIAIIVKTWNSFWSTSEDKFAYLFLFMMMVVFSSATHTIVKFRPMHSMPYLTYHFYFGAMGVSLLLSYITYLAWNSSFSKRCRIIFVSLMWLNILLCAVSRPSLLNHMSSKMEMGEYPDPWTRFIEILK